MAIELCSNSLKKQNISLFKKLKLTTMAQAYESQFGQAPIEMLSFDERLNRLLSHEIDKRVARRTVRLKKAVKLNHNDTFARLEDVILTPDRNIDIPLFNDIKSCQWMSNQTPPSLLITGASGVGKSWLCSAFLNRACELGLSAMYFRATKLFTMLERCRSDGSIERKLEQLKSVKVLAIDDLGIKTMSAGQYSDLLEILNDRYGYRPTIFCSQYPITEWAALMPKAPASDAVLDRIIHSSYLLDLKGPSLRKSVT